MTTYNTGNPVPSADARDRYDNSQVFDKLMNGAAPNSPDRLGVIRQSWAGMENSFNQFLANSGFESNHLIYVDGSPLVVDRPTQLIERGAFIYRVKMPSVFPLSLSGNWSTDSTLLVDVADASLRQELAASSGVTLVSGGDFSEATITADLFSSSVPRPLSDLANSTFRLDNFSGLTPNDPTVDNGPLLNVILGVAAQNRILLDGRGALFYTRTPIKPKAYQLWANLTLKSMGAPAGDTAAKAHIPVIDVNGTSELVTGMRSWNIVADGSRDLWPNVSMSTPGPEGGGSEDGGMHAWRISGRVEDSSWWNCKGINAASAGWAVHNPTPAGSIAYYSHLRLSFYDCDGMDNGEHGMFCDSSDDFKWYGGRLTGNGRDMPGSESLPLTHGLRGRRDSNGKLFGGPFDFESYPPLMGSLFNNVLMQSTDCRNNAVGALLYNPIPTDLAGYVQPDNLRFLDCIFDQGTVAASDRPVSMVGVSFLAAGAQVTAASFGSLTLSSRFAAKAELNYVGRPDFTGSYFNVDNLKIQLNNCGYSELTCAGLTANVAVSPAPITTFERAQGALGMLATPSLQSVHAYPSCGLALNYIVSITGVSGTQAGALLITPPTGFHIASIEFSAYVTANGQPVTSASTINGNGLTAIAFFDSGLGGPLTSGVRINLVPNL